MTIQHVLIMAAGRGNRMRPLTDVIPKALAPFRGSTLIENTIKNFQTSKIEIHITVGYLASILAEVLLKKELAASLLNTHGHDNAWWIFNTLLRFVDKPVLVLTCDNVTDLDLDYIESQYLKIGSPACMLVPVKPIPNIQGDYILCGAKGNVIDLSRNIQTEKYASGIQVINPSKINKIIEPCENFYDVWKSLMQKNELFASNIYNKSWFSIDTLEQLNLSNND